MRGGYGEGFEAGAREGSRQALLRSAASGGGAQAADDESPPTQRPRRPSCSPTTPPTTSVLVSPFSSTAPEDAGASFGRRSAVAVTQCTRTAAEAEAQAEVEAALAAEFRPGPGSDDPIAPVGRAGPCVARKSGGARGRLVPKCGAPAWVPPVRVPLFAFALFSPAPCLVLLPTPTFPSEVTSEVPCAEADGVAGSDATITLPSGRWNDGDESLVSTMAAAGAMRNGGGEEATAPGGRGGLATSTLAANWEPRVPHVADINPRTQWRPRPARVGEATNPGPPHPAVVAPRLRRVPMPEAAAVAYPAPDRQGFRDFAAPGFTRDPGAARPEEQFQLRIESANTTGWLALQKRLESTTAHALLAQETWVLQGAVPMASQWARRRGWKSIWSAAQSGPGGGPSAGVAIFVRDHLGLRYPSVGSHVWHEARAVAGVVEAPSFRPLLVVSTYLLPGQGPSRGNVELLADVGAGVEAQGDAWQTIIGGDQNMEPADFLVTGFDRRLGATVMFPPTERGTFRTSRVASTLDYFVVTDTLAAAVERVETVEGTGSRGHVPVALLFKPRVTALRALHIRRPPFLERERVFGPIPPPPDPTAAAEAAEAALAAARAESSDVQLRIDRAYARWADLAEQELVQYSGKDVKKFGERSRMPRLVWRSVVPEASPRQAYPRAAALTWLRGVLGELIRIGAAAAEGGAAASDRPSQPTHLPDDHRLDTNRGDDDQCDDNPMGEDGGPPPPRRRNADDDGADHLAAERRSRRPPTDIARCHSAIMDIVRSLATDAPGGHPAEGVEAHHAAVARIATDMLNAMTRDAEGIAPRRHWCEVPAPFFADCAAAALAAREAIEAEVKRADADARAEANAAWKAWVADGIEAGASRAHAFTKLPEMWEPTTAVGAGGAVSCAPDALLEGQRAKYCEMWRPVGAPFRYEGIGGDELPMLETEAIRTAALSFAWRTTQTYDGFHPRQIGLLSDGALRALAVLLQAVETAGIWPRQVSMVVSALLPKPRGGFRPIGILPAVYRVWAKSRRADSDRWEREHPRAYLSAARGNGPIDTMWRLGARQESGVAQGLQAAIVAEDIQSFFDVIDRQRLVEEARALGYPMPLVRGALAAYSAARVMTLQGRIAREVYPTAGVVAGCSLAMALTKVYYMRAFDALVTRLPATVTLDAHVDDITLAATGTPTAAVADLLTAHADLRATVEGELGCAFAQGKTAVTATTRPVAAELARKLGVEGGVASTPCLLGVDNVGGARRSKLRNGSKKSARLKAALSRKQRLARLKTAIGDRATRVFRAGLRPAAAYDAPIWGLADSEVLSLRRLAAAAMSPKARGRSLTAVHLWYRLPTAASEHAPALQYARMIWKTAVERDDAARRGTSAADLRRMFEAARVEFQPLVDMVVAARNPDGTIPRAVARRAWGRVRGPFAAAALTLARIGWSFTSAFEVQDERGLTTLLTRTSPALFADLLHSSLTRQLERKVAAAWASDDPTFKGRRACMDLAFAHAKAGKKYTPMQAAIFRSVACGALFTKMRAKQLGYDTDGLCDLCGIEPDTVRHRVYRCPCTEAAVRAAVPQWFWAEAQRTDAAGTFWLNACFPHPADVAPPPRSDLLCEVEWRRPRGEGEQLTDVGGHLYVDGSSSAHAIRDMSRAGCAVVETAADGTPTKVLRIPVPGHLPQTSQCSEYLGMAMVFASIQRAAQVFGDCLNVVRAINGVARRALDARSKYAGIVLTTHADPGRRRLAQSVTWTKAHRAARDDDPPEVARDIRGNAAADAAAKEAAQLHPSAGIDVDATITFYEKRAPHVVAAVVAAMELFPRVARNMGRVPRPADENQAREKKRHHWAFSAGAWRCTICHDFVTARSLPRYRERQACGGRAPADDAADYAARGHRLCKARSALPIVFCSQCGAWGNRRTRNLGASCGQPTQAGLQALRRISKGVHPLLQKDARGRDRPRMQLEVTEIYDPVAARWRPLDGGVGQPLVTDAVGGTTADPAGGGGVGGMPIDRACGPPTDAAAFSDEDIFGHGGGLDGNENEPAMVGLPSDSAAAAAPEGPQPQYLERRASKRPPGQMNAPASARRRIHQTDNIYRRDHVAEAVKRLGDSLRRSDADPAGRMQRLRRRIMDKAAAGAARSVSLGRAEAAGAPPAAPPYTCDEGHHDPMACAASRGAEDAEEQPHQHPPPPAKATGDGGRQQHWHRQHWRQQQKRLQLGQWTPQRQAADGEPIRTAGARRACRDSPEPNFVREHVSSSSGTDRESPGGSHAATRRRGAHRADHQQRPQGDGPSLGSGLLPRVGGPPHGALRRDPLHLPAGDLPRDGASAAIYPPAVRGGVMTRAQLIQQLRMGAQHQAEPIGRAEDRGRGSHRDDGPLPARGPGVGRHRELLEAPSRRCKRARSLAGEPPRGAAAAQTLGPRVDVAQPLGGATGPDQGAVGVNEARTVPPAVAVDEAAEHAPSASSPHRRLRIRGKQPRRFSVGDGKLVGTARPAPPVVHGAADVARLGHTAAPGRPPESSRTGSPSPSAP